MTHSSKVIFQFPKQTIIESFNTRKNILNFTSEKRKLKWPFEVLINDVSSSVGSAFRSFVISVLKDKTIICSDNRPRRSSFQIPCWNKNPKTEINLLCSLSADYSTPFTWAIRSFTDWVY